MALPIAARFLALVKTWRQAHKSGGKDLNYLKSFVESIQNPAPQKTPNVLQELLDEVSSDQLREYVSRGCKPATSETGWRAAEAVNVSFKQLHHAKDECCKISKELEALVDEATSQYKNGASDGSQYKHEAPDGGNPVGKLDDIVFLMAALFEAINKETDMMIRVTEAVQIDTKPSELRTYCLVWDLQPYLDLNLINHLSSLVESGIVE